MCAALSGEGGRFAGEGRPKTDDRPDSERGTHLGEPGDVASKQLGSGSPHDALDPAPNDGGNLNAPADPPEVQPSETRTATDPRTIAASSRRIGRYHIKRVIASGGMGTVYEAMQESPRRAVAVKVMKHGIASRQAMRRFEYEAQILARLRHPGVAQIYEAGIHEEGQERTPFFAMEYIPNACPITAFASRRELRIRDRLALFLRVCDAVHHGHLKGIIHRDLKPSNILVDANGEPKVIDFGVARATDSDMAITTLQTDVGQLVGTLQYMSPEQCDADPHDIDLRSDVYALGVVLYELLTGFLPYDLTQTPVFEAVRLIRDSPPVRPSRHDSSLRGDLETIVLKALEKDRMRRYASAVALADDVRRYLASEPIVAHPPSLVYRTRKLLQRRKKTVAVALLLIAALIVAVERQGAAVRAARLAARDNSLVYYFEALEKADEAQALRKNEQAHKYEESLAFCERALEQDPTLASAYALRGKLHTRQKNNAAAWGDVRKALDLDPGNSLALRTRAFLELSVGRFQEALESYERGTRVLVSVHDLPEDFHNRARILRVLGRYDEAMQIHDRAVALDPAQGRIHQSRGITRYCAGDVDGAIRDWLVAKERDEHSVLQCALWLWETHMLHGESEDHERARAELESIRTPAKSHPLADAIVRHLADGAPEAAVVAAMTDTPTRCQGHYYLGAAALVRGDVPVALSRFEQARATNAFGMLEYDLAECHMARYGEKRP